MMDRAHDEPGADIAGGREPAPLARPITTAGRVPDGKPIGSRDESFVGGTNYSRIGDALRAAIFSREFEPGMRLKVQDLAARYGVSTNPIREALQQLQGEGLIVISPNRGATVRGIDRMLLAGMFDIREALDVMLARRAALLATPEQIGHLNDIEARRIAAVGSGDREGAGLLSGGFHEFIGQIANNLEAVRIRRTHRNIFHSIRSKHGYGPNRHQQIAQEHRAIIQAIASGDPAAAEATSRVHAENSRDDLLERGLDLP